MLTLAIMLGGLGLLLVAFESDGQALTLFILVALLALFPV